MVGRLAGFKHRFGLGMCRVGFPGGRRHFGLSFGDVEVEDSQDFNARRFCLICSVSCWSNKATGLTRSDCIS
jgi:hypothetical protein